MQANLKADTPLTLLIVFLGARKVNFKIFRNISQSFVILLVSEKGRYMKSGKLLLIIIFFITCVGDGIAQQQVDKNFVPQPFKCKLCDSASRIVAVDAAHYNFHTVDNTLQNQQLLINIMRWLVRVQ